VTSYSLEYLNTSGRFSPPQILQSLRRRPKGSMLLYGPPGTGKTQFTEYLASELNLPLVSKSASALLSKWLGDSEKNIAAAFEEAAAEDAILFFDEGDSFLRSRERALHSWEVTQTNELLQRMERFDGIVIVATNLFRDLDTAALRRFTFKIEFRELDLSQRWRMFVAEAGLTNTAATLNAATRESWEQRLLFMKYLTPGDFATVKRQCLVLDTVLTPEEWLDQLEIECQIKSAMPHIEASHRAA
jgi:SpoVK/Ycf46/Vps4 family AAA+-type ATPase